jgi:hypothetical protein
MKVHVTMRDRPQPATAISQQERALFCDADRKAHKVGLSQLVSAWPGIRMLTRQVILALGSIAHPWTPPSRGQKRPERGLGDVALLHLLIRAPAERAIN